MFPKYLAQLFNIKPKQVYPILLWTVFLLPLVYSLFFMIGFLGGK
jgi:hypothetical protein